MHMADALISPVVGVTLTAAAAGLGAWSVHRLRQENDDERIPLMGVMGAFVFTAQMINFSIPGTGSSGHLGGGLLLAALLGPHAAFLTITAILIVQAFFFGDGGLLALGCNILNMGFFPCFIAWPFIFKPLMGSGASRGRTFTGALSGAVLSLQAGAFSVVLETLFSGRTELPFGTFTLMMQPIHLAIGIVEGLVTAAIVLFMLDHRPETLQGMRASAPASPRLRRKSAVVMVLLTLIIAAVLSSFASSAPDGLEWSMLKTAGADRLAAQGPLYEVTASLQHLTAFFPDYHFKTADQSHPTGLIDPGTAASGLVGGAVTLLFLSAVSAVLLRRRRRPAKKTSELL